MRLLFPLFFLLSFSAAATTDSIRFPATFEYNAGQTKPDVLFLSRAPESTITLTRRGFRLKTSSGWASLEFAGANPNAEITGVGLQPGHSNYFTGKDPSQWKTGVPNYARVRYSGVYPGVDAVFYRNEGQLEFDLELKPGADPRSVRLSVDGNEKIGLDRSGNLIFGTAVLRRPAVYQERDGWRKSIPAAFFTVNQHEVAFRIGRYDRARPLVIDPVLTYSTHLGGGSPSDTTAIYGIGADAAGNAYVTGFTSARDFPLQKPAQARYGGDNGDAFVAKISADGSTLLYSTFLGGSNTDQGNAIAVDSSGSAYVTGVTESSDFPAVNPFQQWRHSSKGSGGTGFIAKLSPDGSKLIFSSWLGGSGAENPSGIALDSTTAAYITGVTYSADFPVVNALQASPAGATGTSHGFVAKVRPDGAGLLYSTYLGGSAADRGMGIAVDPAGSAYVTGYTQSPDFPIRNAYLSTLPGAFDTYAGYPPAAFVTKFAPDGRSLIYSTFLGGRVEDGGVAIAVDGAGSAYVLGRTASPNFPVKSGLPPILPGTHAFVTKMSADGASLVYSTVLGGSSGSELTWSNDSLVYNAPGGIAVDSQGHAFVTGGTTSADFPVTADAFQPQRGAGAFTNGFLSELTANGSFLVYSTFLGGPSLDSAFALALDAAGNAYVGGRGGVGFPSLNPLPGGLDGGAFIARIGTPSSPQPAPQVGAIATVDGAAAVAAASWIVITGTNLSPVTRDWAGEINYTGNLPTQLGATTVTVNGKPAYIYYVSPTQINAIAPDDSATGAVPVIVTVNGVSSAAVNAQLNRLAPALFLWPANYAVATHLDYSLAVKNGVFPSQTTVSAKRGETIVLWGTGLGAVTPPTPAGIVTQATGFVQSPVTVHFGSVTQPALAAALTQGNAAVYQIAVIVPASLAPGDYAIAIEINGVVASTGTLTVM